LTGGHDRLRTVCITVLGSGFVPVAPGTCGSLVATGLFAAAWVSAAAVGLARGLVELAVIAGILLSSWLSVRWGPWAVARFGKSDPRQFTLDEFAGQCLALLALPIGLDAGRWALACVLGGQFLLFRLLDILKPPPAHQAEALPAGWGILADDLAAGLYANILGQLLWRLTPLAVWLRWPSIGM
jgi:phosphatidylglycerophosphatase A